jgi:pyruvate dehydrogenase E1 component
VVLAYQGCVAAEVLAAAGRIGESRRDIGVLAVTSSDRLNAGWTAAQRARRRGVKKAKSHIETLFTGLPSYCTLVTVTDGHPATLAWLGAVVGHKTIPLGVEHFGQTGTIADLYRHYGLDTESIVRAVSDLTPGRAVNELLALS